jgi:ADP-L-glycero-D-manno-heptose 6-epimerase
MRILVTGAAGFVGSNLSLELERRGHEVVGLDDFSCASFENLNGFKGDFVTADLRREETWKDAVGAVEAIFHEAAITDTTFMDPIKMMGVNVDAFRKLLAWAAKNKTKKVVYASSAAVYGDGAPPMKESAVPHPLNIYGFSKNVMESTAATFAKQNPKIKVAGLRYFNVFGPRESHKGIAASMILQLCNQMRQGRRPRVFEFGEQYRDFIYVKDVVKANLLALEKAPSGVYNVCTGQKTSFNQIINELNRVLGTRLEPDYFKNPYAFYQNETLGDPSKSAKTFGFKAEYSMSRAVSDYFGGTRPVAVNA